MVMHHNEKDMGYTHPTSKRQVNGYNSHKEHCFYEETTKRQMHLMIQQMSERLKDNGQDWEEFAINERNLLKLNGIK
jgi:hypothetical protein